MRFRGLPRSKKHRYAVSPSRANLDTASKVEKVASTHELFFTNPPMGNSSFSKDGLESE